MSIIIDMHLYGHARSEQKRGTEHVVIALLILGGLVDFVDWLLNCVCWSVWVSALSAGACTTTLLVMVDRVKGGGRARPTLTRLGCIYHHDGMYARKWTLPDYLHSLVCVFLPSIKKLCTFPLIHASDTYIELSHLKVNISLHLTMKYVLANLILASIVM